MVSNYVKCSSCGWVHYAVSLGEAQAAVDDFNSYAACAGLEQRSLLSRYLSCIRCGTATYQCVPFVPEREPGYTMQPVVID